MTIEAPKNIAETIIEEFKHTGNYQAVSLPSPANPLAPFIIGAPEHIKLHDLTEQHRRNAQALKPLQRTGQAKLDDLQSLIDWTNRFKGKETVLFGQLKPTPRLVSVIDYHGAGEMSVSPEGDPSANYGRHTAIYTFPVSEEWIRWNAISSKMLSKDEFGVFIEDNFKDFLDPTPALLGNGSVENAAPWEHRMIEVAAKLQGRFGQYAALNMLSREFKAHEVGHLQVTTNRDTGEAQVQFLTEHRDPDGQPLKLPNLFMIAIPVFEEGAHYRLAVRFQYRKAGQDVRFIVTLHNPDVALRDAAREALETARNETGVPLMIGIPEIGVRN